MSTPEGPGRRLRFGLLGAGPQLSGFQRECLEQVLAVPGTELVIRVVDAAPPQPASKSQQLKKLLKVRGALWPIFQKLFPWNRTTAHQRAEAPDLLDGAPALPCTVYKKGKWSEYFPDEVIARIRDLDLDFLLKFGFGIVRGDILTVARYGVWSFHHDDPDVYRGGPPAFWEIHDAAPSTGAVLQRLTERLDGGVMLQRCWASTHRSSYAENYARILWTSAAMPARVCRDILSGSAAYLKAPPIKTDAPIYRAPNNRAMLRFAFRVTAARLAEWRDRALVEQWRVGVAKAKAESFLDLDEPPPIEWIPNPGSARYWADPFALESDDSGIRMIVEEYDHRLMRGVISEIDWRPGGVERVGDAIDDARHHSYPFVLHHDGDVLCVPETASERRVRLYRRNGSGDWERAQTLLDDIPAVDPTIFEHDGRWWMLLTRDDGPKNANLWAYYSSNLEGPWTSHANNPVKLDVRSSRPAGPPFRRGSELFRPAQDCSRSYGCRLALNRILTLTPTEMEEETVGWIGPDPAGACPHGFHSLVGAGPWTLVDGARMEFDLGFLAFRARRAILKRLGAATK